MKRSTKGPSLLAAAAFTICYTFCVYQLSFLGSLLRKRNLEGTYSDAVYIKVARPQHLLVGGLTGSGLDHVTGLLMLSQLRTVLWADDVLPANLSRRTDAALRGEMSRFVHCVPNTYYTLRNTSTPGARPTLYSLRSKKPCHVAQLKVERKRNFNMSSLVLLLDSAPHMHIMYVARDPRATARIQNEWSTKKGKHYMKDLKYACLRQLEDLRTYSKLPTSSKQRISILRYEDLTSEAVRRFEKPFNKIGLSFCPRQERFRLKGVGCSDKTRVCQQWKPERPYMSWKNYLTPRQLEEVTQLCQESLKAYLEIKT